MRRLLAALFLTYCIFFIYHLHVPLVDEQHPLRIYSSSDTHLHLLVKKIIQSARFDLRLYSFGVNDALIADTLAKKASPSLFTTLVSDPYLESAPIKNILYLAKHSRGLMHKKAVISDLSSIYLGSLNLTSTSMLMHDNLVIGFYDPDLVRAFLQNKCYETPRLRFFPLPSYRKKALRALLDAIDGAKFRIRVAMFTFTHPLITTALIRAFQRGVDVKLVLDHRNFAFPKRVELFKQAGIPLYSKESKELLHYKMAQIDDMTVFGSVNWTKNGFQKNEEVLLFINSPLPEIELLFDLLVKKHPLR